MKPSLELQPCHLTHREAEAGDCKSKQCSGILSPHKMPKEVCGDGSVGAMIATPAGPGSASPELVQKVNAVAISPVLWGQRQDPGDSSWQAELKWQAVDSVGDGEQ